MHQQQQWQAAPLAAAPPAAQWQQPAADVPDWMAHLPPAAPLAPVQQAWQPPPAAPQPQQHKPQRQRRDQRQRDS